MMFDLIMIGFAAWLFRGFTRLTVELIEDAMTPEVTIEEHLQQYRDYLKKRNLRVRDQFPVRR